LNCMARPEGFEPPTPRSVVVLSFIWFSVVESFQAFFVFPALQFYLISAGFSSVR
jgi:hypothetical protein